MPSRTPKLSGTSPRVIAPQPCSTLPHTTPLSHTPRFSSSTQTPALLRRTRLPHLITTHRHCKSDEDGKEINPHIPQYMTNAPWYLNSDKPTLKHQRNWKEQVKDQLQWYDRGAKVFQATKFRKGACEK